MQYKNGMPIAIIGAGISGITTAHILKKNGFQAVVFEKSQQVGGVWALAYPNVHLQNIKEQYHLSDFPWPFTPDLHPTGEQILNYLEQAVNHLNLDVRLNHEVIELKETEDGWLLKYKNQDGVHEELFGYVVISVGQYTEGKYQPEFPGIENFGGKIITERDVHTLDIFDNQRVVILGFGKSALDMATFAAKQGAQVNHVFRTPRWLVPEWILGVHFTHALFSRFGTVMMTSWAHPTAIERFLHNRLGFIVSGFWDLIASIFRFQVQRNVSGKGQEAQRRIQAVQPDHKLLPDLRSATAVAPENYYPFIAEGKISPHRAELSGFSRESVKLKNGCEIPCDLVILSLGSQTPIFPFLPDQYRKMLEIEPDGVQLYRHLLHPRIPGIAFAGFNHGYMHVPAVEIATQWLCAYLRGELELPSSENMEKSIEYIRQWKRANIQFEPSRSCAINTRFQQYIDIMLKDMGVSPYRKLPNVFAEIFGRYQSSDYLGVSEEYNHKKKSRSTPLHPLPLDT
ncbi:MULTISPECIES: flavin-containing monooxygenase [unclassified Microcoleus]|uniref:flavin-containing monooxygenase n=1 Tax=unclassified Microcoleus TaxID=2642155 RepID=UPI002FD4FF0E